MRVDALIPLTTTAEYWDFEKTQDPDSGAVTNTYFKSKDIKLMFTEVQNVPTIFTRELLRFNGQLRAVKDVRGTDILDPSQFYFLTSPKAQFDVFGNVMGYKYEITPATVGTTVQSRSV